MDKNITFEYAVISLVKILFEEHLINEPTMRAIITRVQDEQSHISQKGEKNL